ncbi:MAG: anthranilate synthase component I family protein [Proteobacteria bacterium]|nr:anthranilate synthase component I family protein [Pseudomonadota bacterium]
MSDLPYQMPVSDARPPHALVEGFPQDCDLRILEGCADGGWGTAPVGSGPRGAPLRLLAANPDAEFRGGIEALEAALAWLSRHAGEPRGSAILVGSLSYALGAEFEPNAPRARDFDTQSSVDLAAYRAHYRYSPADRVGCVVGGSRDAVRGLREMVGRAGRCGPRSRERPRPWPGQSWLDADAYRERVGTIRDWIRAGDVYQVNLARRVDLDGVTRAQARGLYARLAARSGASFGAYLESPERVVVSNSPERYLRLLGRRVETCPIKGTRPRGETPSADSRLAESLRASAKDAAEHLMIVDLERNDLGRVCEIGSVRVAELAALRAYPTVWHLVSSVQGELRPGVDLLQLLAASFPGGSITGAPKLRAMQIIEDLEPTGRDVYTGAIGYVDSRGDADWSIAIRTAILREKCLRLYVGAGIVADSDADLEWQETRDKARAFRELWGPRA